MPDLEAIKRLEHKIFAVTAEDAEEDDGYEVIFSALLRVFVFWMARRCPNCRRKIAQVLKKHIPTMLETANEAAAQFAADDLAERGRCH